ncbi:hypothetical protein DER53_03470 [Parageobacillus toebii NBRC 107807]|uniref:Transposase-like protein n=1 Tax=Parageobacillus toebii NBRC 107807 TaxID=1223503 RepID=A0A6G9IZZ1_9BACL|nr:hypothetical protein [Parageobacillus toebii]MBB3868694.1 transposase-like protein [Parageobacillus toebii NBRC 107807]QIQ32028.1 hypothetical protein DER53_03470 [Parageobacillus toebii NBRC 107807]
MDDNKEYCPFCGADLQGPPILQEIQHHYGATHGSRKIRIYSREEDRVIKWQCPDCGKEWERE